MELPSVYQKLAAGKCSRGQWQNLPMGRPHRFHEKKRISRKRAWQAEAASLSLSGYSQPHHQQEALRIFSTPIVLFLIL
jgi:hypothetical protein